MLKEIDKENTKNKVKINKNIINKDLNKKFIFIY